MILFYLLVCQILIVKNIFCANILYIDPVVSPSHHIWNEVLVAGLLKNGHNITLISHYAGKIKADNYTVLKMEGADSILKELNVEEIMNSDTNLLLSLKYLWDYSLSFADISLNSTAVDKLLEYPKNHFDLIIFDFSCGQYLYPFLDYFGNPPTVAVSPFGLSPFILNFMGSHYYSYYPIYVTPFTDNMTFNERMYNFILYQASALYEYYYMGKMRAKAEEKFGEGIPSYDEAMRRIGILLVNYDPILDFPQPLPPHIIPVGGLHVGRSAKIAPDLQQILDKAPHGVIYFSFGTNVQPSWFTPQTKKIFLAAFKKLKQTVLWKYNADDLEDVPENVIIRKWFPQTDILAHENVELFITHCGGLGTQEGMYHGVPLVGIPIFLDQKANAIRMENKSLGRRLDLASLNVDDLYEAIQEVLNNPKYSRNMRKVSEIFKSQKETPLERGVFWIEYALKHKDLNHLSIKARDMSFIQQHNFDIYVVLALLIGLFILFIKNLL